MLPTLLLHLVSTLVFRTQFKCHSQKAFLDPLWPGDAPLLYPRAVSVPAANSSPTPLFRTPSPPLLEGGDQLVPHSCHAHQSIWTSRENPWFQHWMAFSAQPERALLSTVWNSIPTASLVAQMVKNPPTMQETQVWSLGWEDPLKKKMENGNPL